MRQALAAMLVLAAGLAAAPPTVDAHGDPLPADALARLGTLRFRPGSYIKHLEFTPDGKRIVSSGNWCGVAVWDAATGRVVTKQSMPLARDTSWARLAQAGKSVYTIEYENGGHWVDADGNSNTVVRHRRLTDLQEVTKGFNPGPLYVLGLSPDGKWLVGQVREMNKEGHPHSLEIWAIKEGKKLRSWPAHQGQIRAWAFTADGTTLASGGEDKVIRFWDVATGAKKFEIADHPDMVGVLALSADGNTLASVGVYRVVYPNGSSNEPARKQICLWDVPTRKERHRIDTAVWVLGNNDYRAVQFAPDGKTLASAGDGGRLRLWDVTTGKLVREIAHGDRGLYAYAFSPNGKTVALGYTDIRVVTVADGKDVVSQVGHRHPIRSAVLLGDNRTVATVGDRTILLWDRQTGRQVRRVDHEKWLEGLRVLPDGRTLVGGDLDGTTLSWDSTTGRELRRFPPGDINSYSLVRSPDGKTVAVEGEDKSLRLVDLGTGKEVGRVTPAGKGLNGVDFSGDGRRLYTWHADYTTTVWDLQTSKAIRTFEFGADPIPPVVPGVVRVRIPPAPKHSGSYTAKVSPDGRLIAYGNQQVIAADQQGFLALHDTETGKPVRRVENLGNGPGLFAFSPDGRMLAWAASRNDTAIHLLEVASGKERTRLVGHRGRVNSLEFADDGRTLVTASEDTTAIVWDVLGGSDTKETLSPKDLDRCWADLADADAAKAFQAMRRLARSPAETVAYLNKHLIPVPVVAEARLAKLIADLDSDVSAERERASRELEKLDDVAADACRKALAEKPSAEKRRRLERLLKPIDAQAQNLSGERLRLVRSLEVLDRMPSAEVSSLLKTLADGAPSAFLTREARTSLSRPKGR